MIIPAGKNRLQVNQGGLKHESILDSELFKKFAALTGETGVEEPPTADPEISSAVGDPFNKGIEQLDRQQSGIDGVQNKNQGSAIVNPNEQQNAIQELDWPKVSQELDAFVKKISNGAMEMKSQSRGNKGEWTITFGPVGVMRG